MGFLTTLRSSGSFRANYSDWDDFWFRRVPSMTDAGVSMSGDAAMTLSAFWAGVTTKAQDFASLPCLLYQRDGRAKDRATRHALYRRLRWQPNPSQTAYEFFEMASGHLDTRGNFYAQIVENDRGMILALLPRHPDRVRVLGLTPAGLRQYEWAPSDGREPQKMTQMQMMHVCGYSSDGMKGLSAIEYGARSLGIALAGDTYAGNFFRNGAAPAFAVKHPLTLGEDGQKNLRDSIKHYNAGLSNAHGVLILEEGMDVSTIGIKPQEAQLIEARVFGIEEIARWINMPLHKLKVNKPGSVSYASVEMFDIEYVMDTMGPLARRFEQVFWRDLLSETEQQTYFAEFLLDARLRGDSASRAAFYKSGYNRWLTRNEIREKENMNPVPGGDEWGAADGDPAPRDRNAADDPRDPRGRPQGHADSRARLIALEAAARVVQKEIAQATRAAQKHGNDAEAWQAWLGEFYGDHAGFVGQVLKVPSHQARAYADARMKELGSTGIAAVGDWETRVVPQLAALALGENDHVV
jgi:HK97 family phage portal protein